MINQATTLQRVRMPVVAIAAFALGALASALLPQLHIATATPPAIVITQAPTTNAHPIVTNARAQSMTTCGQGAYVSGDLVGDASPATVYATMCPR